ncbi:MAG: outer membrane protein assembly factor BamA [SAR324 cluster bacterium]|nr:outer membrane protein assembly factor BamA [SAR324 cluster bacterium]
MLQPLQSHAQENRIVNIEVTGTSELEVAQILFALETQVNAPVDQRSIRRDIHTIYDMGLFQDVQVEVEQTPEGYVLRIHVTESPRVVRIILEGRTLVSQKDLQEKMTLKKMDIYDPVAVTENIKIIEDQYRKEGYARVYVESRIEEKTEQEYFLYFSINEAPRSYLTDIIVKGAYVYSELDIKRFILSSEVDCFSWINESGIFQEEKVNQDMALIAQHYLKLGYIKVFINKPRVILYRNPDYSRLEINMDIKEGPQYFAGKIDISGDILGEKEKLMELLALKEGDVYNPFLQNTDRASLNEVYQEQGYAFVRIIPRTNIHEENRTVDVTYHIVKKEKAYIGRLDVAGNAETRDYVIRREFEIQEDELYNGKKLQEGQQNLERLGFFEAGMGLEKNARDDEDNILDIVTRLRETQTGSFQAQLGYSDQSRFTGGVQLSKGNLFGRGQTLRLSAQFSERDVQNDYNITFIEPRLFDSRTSTSISFSHRRLTDNTDLNRGEINENTYGIGFGHPIYRMWRFALRFNATDRLFQKDYPNIIKRSISPSLTYNTVNHPVFPSDGLKNTFTLTHTGTPFGGNTRFREYEYQYQQFWSLNENRTLIVMGQARLGYLQKLDDFPIPSEDRFRVGGINSLRGFEFYEVSGPFGPYERDRHQKQTAIINPLGLQQTTTVDDRTENLTPEQLKNLESGGISQRIFNLELLFPLSQDERSFVRGVIFMDAGNVNAESIQYELLDVEEPKFLDLRRSAGVGARLITPVGVLRFEYGFKLDKRPKESPDKFEFNISGLF